MSAQASAHFANELMGQALQLQTILAEGAIALSVTLSGGALFAS
jgi:hypothetical protein